MVTTTEQRRAGAPKPTESLEQRARRLAAAGLTTAQRAVDWPIHVAEIEPSWAEMKAAQA